MSAGDAAALVRVITRGDATWPVGLEHLHSVPDRLWVVGFAAPRAPAVAIVGARRCSVMALRAAEALARDLGRAGVQVVSGMALGVDGAAHRGALAGGGTTVAVLGCGVDVCYPARHRELRAEIVRGGSLVSEEPPGTEPERWRFPKRNRLIAALCVAVVVVEAGERSGALSTARHAADLGREVLAMPGAPLSEMTLGNNHLIRDGATLIIDAADVVAAVPALASAVAVAPQPPAEPRRRGPNAAAEQAVLDLCAGGATHPDELLARLPTTASRLARTLGALARDGRVVDAGGGRIQAATAASDGVRWVEESPRPNSRKRRRAAAEPLL